MLSFRGAGQKLVANATPMSMRAILIGLVTATLLALAIGSTALIYSVVTTTTHRDPVGALVWTVENETVTNTLLVTHLQCSEGTTLPEACLPALGSLGGDVTGSSSNSTVVGLQRTPLAAVAPTSPGQFVGFNGSHWLPGSLGSEAGSNIVVSNVAQDLLVATTEGVVFQTLAVVGETLLGLNTSCIAPLLPSCYDISSQTCPAGPLQAECIPSDLVFNNLVVHNLTLFNATTLDVPIGNQTVINVDQLFVAEHQYLQAPLTCQGGGSVDSGCLNLGNYSCPLGQPLADSCIPASLVQYDQTVTHELTVNLVQCVGPPLPLSCLPSLALAGDVVGTLGVNTVVGLQGVPLSSGVPLSNQFLGYNGSQWLASDIVAGSNVVITPLGAGLGGILVATTADMTVSNLNVTGNVTCSAGTPVNPNCVPDFAGDVTGSVQNTVVVALQGVPLTATPPTDGQYLVYSMGGGAWTPTTVSLTLGGDVTGPIGANTVAKLQGRTMSSAAPANGANLVWDATNSQWAPLDTRVYFGTNTQTNSGTSTVTIGPSATTLGSTNSTAIGIEAIARSINGVAIGRAATTSTTGTSAVAVGNIASATGLYGVAVGVGTTASSTSCVAIGDSAQATTTAAISIGGSSVASASYTVAVGKQSSTSATQSVAVGYLAQASASSAVCVGYNAQATAVNAVCIGQSSSCGGSSGVAIGSSASSNGIGTAVALGAGASPVDTAHSLAFAINSASVVAGTLGVTLNGATNIIQTYGSLYSTTAGAGPTTLTATSAKQQYFTTAQTVTLPVTSTLQLGFYFKIVNAAASGNVVIQSSGANTVTTIAPGAWSEVTCILTSGTTAGSWNVRASSGATGTDGQVLAWDATTASWVPNGANVFYGTNTQTNSGTGGTVTIGPSATTSGTTGAVALGNGAIARNVNAVAVGPSATCSTTGSSSVAVGASASATGSSAVAVGINSVAGAQQSVAIGNGASCSTTGTSSVALGNTAGATGVGTVAIGLTAVAGVANSVAVGRAATCSTTGTSSVAVGYTASANGTTAVAVGVNSLAGVANGIAIGSAATTNGIATSVALGAGASPVDTAHSLAFAINSASVVPGTLGVTINGAAKVLDAYTSLYTTTAGAGPTVLTATSSKIQWFTTAQTVTLPVVATLQLGFYFEIVNNSGGLLVVQSSGGNTKIILLMNTWAKLVCISTTGTTDASWGAMVGGAVS